MCRFEAIVVCTTSREIENKMLEKFFLQLRYEPRNKIDIIIFTNNNKYSRKNILFLVQMNQFNSIKFINMNIHPDDDLYQFKYNKQSDYIPSLGYLSGPNIMFFKIMDWCKNYDTVLLLETDCIIRSNMVQVCKTYIESLDDFFVSGSYYHGKLILDKNVRFHLNGVAFYRTGSQEFQDFIKNVRLYMEDQVNDGTVFIAYDTSLYQYIKTMPEHAAVRKKYIANNIIINLSPREDASTSMSAIANAFPKYVILHKKS
jgi:hypothetical protein